MPVNIMLKHESDNYTAVNYRIVLVVHRQRQIEPRKCYGPG